MVNGKRYRYEQSAYGNPWEASKQADTLEGLARYRSPFWLKMLPERHHRIVDTLTDVTVWQEESKIAPPPGSKEKKR